MMWGIIKAKKADKIQITTVSAKYLHLRNEKWTP